MQGTSLHRAGRPRPTGVALLDELVSGVLPGLGLVLAGQLGTGRTVLCLQLARAALLRGERVVLLTAEPPGALLRQAESLELELGPGVETGRLVLLELVPDVANVVRGHGLAPLVEALQGEVPDAELWLVDPLTALTQDLIDERPLRAGVAALLGESAQPRPITIATADSAHLTRQPALERALSDVSGALLHLGRDESGERSLSVLKSRLGKSAAGRVRFEIGPGGARALRVPAAERGAPLAAEPEPLPREAPRPAAPVSAAPVSAPAPAAALARAQPRILVVDADEGSRAQLAASLRASYDVVGAGDGFAALSAILSQRPDVVVLDLALGEISGYEVLRVLARSAGAPPVIALSDRLLRAADRIRALVLGAHEVLPKTCAALEVRLKVEALLRSPQPRLRDLGLELDGSELLLLASSKERRVGEGEFRTRIERAQRFGERFGVTSSAVAIAAASPDALDILLHACEAILRAEDCIYALDEQRALLLAVASTPERAPLILDRLRARAGGELALRWGAKAVTDEVLRADWDKYFEGIECR